MAVTLGILREPEQRRFFGPGRSPVFVVALPEAEARRLIVDSGFGVGLGVYPASRDPLRFLLEVGRGAPSTNDQVYENRLARALGSFVIGDLTRGDPSTAEALATAFQTQPLGTPGIPGATELRVYALRTAKEASVVARSGVGVIFGIGDRTPVLVGISSGFDTPGRLGLLSESITRRPGIVTPYDVAATILDLAYRPIPEGIAGNRLRSHGPVMLEKIDALAARLERDDSYAPGLAAVTVGLGVITIFLSYGLMRLGRREAALRVAQGAVLVLPGWVVAIFVPTGRWYLRALVVIAAALLGASMRPRVPLSTMARVGLGSAIGFGVLAAMAPLNPGGEPGLSIWGNPLVSWRFFGLQNVEAAIIASGIVIWGTVAGLTAPLLAAISVAAAVVTGAPTIGANFVGVLTFVFGAAAVTIALARRRTNLGHVVIAGVMSVAAFALALLADAGSPVSHGGRAARKISDGGFSAAWDLVEGRLKLNWELIRDFTGGVLWVIGLAISLAMLIRWGLDAERGPFRGRVAVLGGALMAAASLVLEDSGFYSGAVLWFVAANAWLLLRLTQPGLGVIPPESDAPLAGVGAGTKLPQPGEARRSRSSRD